MYPLADVIHPWRPCTSPTTYDRLPDADYVFHTRLQGSTLTHQTPFTVDTQPPEILLTSAPALVEYSTSALFRFQIDDPAGATAACQLLPGEMAQDLPGGAISGESSGSSAEAASW